MAFNLDNPVGTGTDQELLDLYRACLARISVNQEYEVRGRRFAMADLKEVRETITWLESRVDSASPSRRAVNYAKRMRPY